MKKTSDLSRAARILLFDENNKHVPIQGNSMSPLLRHNQKVRIVPFDGLLKRGHCYVFIYNGSLVVHRLVGAAKSVAIFMGDKSCSREEVSVDHVLGEVAVQQNALSILLINTITAFLVDVLEFMPFNLRLRKYLVLIINTFGGVDS